MILFPVIIPNPASGGVRNLEFGIRREGIQGSSASKRLYN
jgi:hypothetical protein